MMLEDGTGTGRKAKVNADNQLEVRSIMTDALRYINVEKGRVWALPIDAVAPSGATWFIVLFNGGTSTYVFTKLVLCSSVAGQFRISKVTGTPVGGTSLSPSALNVGSASLMDLVTIQTGTSITGLTESGLIVPVYLTAGMTGQIETGPGIIVPPGQTGVAMKAPGAATVNGYIEIYELSADE